MAFDLPAWGVALLVLYPLAQLPVVLYLSRYVELRDGESAPHPAEGYAFHGGDADGEPAGHPVAPTEGSVTAGDHADEAGVTCRRCGAANGVEFRFCRDCVARLA